MSRGLRGADTLPGAGTRVPGSDVTRRGSWSQRVADRTHDCASPPRVLGLDPGEDGVPQGDPTQGVPGARPCPTRGRWWRRWAREPHGPVGAAPFVRGALLASVAGAPDRGHAASLSPRCPPRSSGVSEEWPVAAGGAAVWGPPPPGPLGTAQPGTWPSSPKQG